MNLIERGIYDSVIIKQSALINLNRNQNIINNENK